MHALVTRVTIHDADRTREMLNSTVVPGVSVAPGFPAGYWTWSASGGGERNGLAMMVFDSEENARSAGDRVRAAAESSDDVTLDEVEVREVVASA
jgi:hypothetical protein